MACSVVSNRTLHVPGEPKDKSLWLLERKASGELGMDEVHTGGFYTQDIAREMKRGKGGRGEISCRACSLRRADKQEATKGHCLDTDRARGAL